jgi:hypothetical protein
VSRIISAAAFRVRPAMDFTHSSTWLGLIIRSSTFTNVQDFTAKPIASRVPGTHT